MSCQVGMVVVSGGDALGRLRSLQDSDHAPDKGSVNGGHSHWLEDKQCFRRTGPGPGHRNLLNSCRELRVYSAMAPSFLEQTFRASYTGHELLAWGTRTDQQPDLWGQSNTKRPPWTEVQAAFQWVRS